MTYPEVEAILGPPKDTSDPRDLAHWWMVHGVRLEETDELRYWKTPDFEIHVALDQGGTVRSKGCFQPERRNDGVLVRVGRWIGVLPQPVRE